MILLRDDSIMLKLLMSVSYIADSLAFAVRGGHLWVRWKNEKKIGFILLYSLNISSFLNFTVQSWTLKCCYTSVQCNKNKCVNGIQGKKFKILYIPPKLLYNLFHVYFIRTVLSCPIVSSHLIFTVYAFLLNKSIRM